MIKLILVLIAGIAFILLAAILFVLTGMGRYESKK